VSHEIGHRGFFCNATRPGEACINPQTVGSEQMLRKGVSRFECEIEAEKFLGPVISGNSGTRKLAALRASAREFALAELDVTNATHSITRVSGTHEKPARTKSTAGAPERCQARFSIRPAWTQVQTPIILVNFAESDWMRGGDGLWLMFVIVAAETGRCWQPFRRGLGAAGPLLLRPAIAGRRPVLARAGGTDRLSRRRRNCT
jgi:hypothetical protein